MIFGVLLSFKSFVNSSNAAVSCVFVPEFLARYSAALRLAILISSKFLPFTGIDISIFLEFLFVMDMLEDEDKEEYDEEDEDCDEEDSNLFYDEQY